MIKVLIDLLRPPLDLTIASIRKRGGFTFACFAAAATVTTTTAVLTHDRLFRVASATYSKRWTGLGA